MVKAKRKGEGATAVAPSPLIVAARRSEVEPSVVAAVLAAQDRALHDMNQYPPNVVIISSRLGLPARTVQTVLRAHLVAAKAEARRSEEERAQEASRARLSQDNERKQERFGQAVGPTPERAVKGSIVDGVALTAGSETAKAVHRKIRRVQTPIECYQSRKDITARQAAAARKLRDDWEFGIVGARDDEKGSGGGGVIGYVDLRLDAVTAYRDAMGCLADQSTYEVVYGVVIGDEYGNERTVRDISRGASRESAKLMGLLRGGLDAMANQYGLSSPEPQNVA